MSRYIEVKAEIVLSTFTLLTKNVPAPQAIQLNWLVSQREQVLEAIPEY
jgi:hypothetical protein